MTYREEVVRFETAGETLLGVIARPEDIDSCGVLILVGGPQYRVGSHRQFVLLSRRLATEGYATMRFDFRGMGDSSGTFPGFENIGDDVGAAIRAFQRECPGVTRFVLLGLCDAASAALLYWGAIGERRVAGLCLMNPWVRSEVSLAQAQIKHYYLQRLGELAFWQKLLGGRFNVVQSLSGFGQAISRVLGRSRWAGPNSSFQSRMADALRRFPGGVLLILAGADLTAREFEEYVMTDPAWNGVLAQRNIHCHRVGGADHTFSTQAWRYQVENCLVEWLKGRSDLWQKAKEKIK